MTKEAIAEIIERLELLKVQIERDYDIGYQDDLNEAIIALRKGIPVKPIENPRGTGEYMCGNCEAFWLKREMRYCPCCGQRINWSGI